MHIKLHCISYPVCVLVRKVLRTLWTGQGLLQWSVLGLHVVGQLRPGLAQPRAQFARDLVSVRVRRMEALSGQTNTNEDYLDYLY